jgi:hypothetical protein
MGSEDADKLFSGLLDDAIRTNERVNQKISNQAVADACEQGPKGEKYVREWRDLNADKNMHGAKIVQLIANLPSVGRSLLANLNAFAAERAGEGGAVSPLEQLRVSMRSATDLVREAIDVAEDGHVSDDEADRVRSLTRALRRDIDRLEAKLPPSQRVSGVPDEPTAPAAHVRVVRT